MPYASGLKLVFCVLVSVILCLLNYSLYYQYDVMFGQSMVPTSQLSMRYRNTSMIAILTARPDFTNVSLPTQAMLEANAAHANAQLQDSDYQKPTDRFALIHNRNGGTDTGQQVVINPPTTNLNSRTRQLPSAVAVTGRSVEDASHVNKMYNDGKEQSSELQDTGAGAGQTELELQRSEPEELTTSLKLTHTTGFVVAMKIYEQQTMASGNLMQLQCWAKLLNMAVVKPFTKDSFFSTPMDQTKHYTMLTLDNTFDMEDWTQHTAKLGYAPLVNWDYFVQNAPRDVIVVQIKYPTLTHVKKVRSNGLPFPHPPAGEEYKEGCGFKMLSSGKLGTNLKALSFRIVRKVCFNFLTGDELSLKQFHEDILGEYQPGEVTIIIDEWRGIKENQRVLIKDDICLNDYKYREHLKPSQHLIRDAKAYVERFLQNNATTSNNHDYLAIIARYEMTGLTRSMNKDGDPHAIIPYCLQLTLETMEKMQTRTGLTNTFLSVDIGKYGSNSFLLKNYFDHLKDMEAFVGKVYRGEMDVRGWEKTFEAVAETTDAGYIAMLQEVLVVRAKCIIFVGGGSFQRHAFNLYKELHPHQQDQCYEVIEKCTTPYRPIQK